MKTAQRLTLSHGRANISSKEKNQQQLHQQQQATAQNRKLHCFNRWWHNVAFIIFYRSRCCLSSQSPSCLQWPPQAISNCNRSIKPHRHKTRARTRSKPKATVQSILYIFRKRPFFCLALLVLHARCLCLARCANFNWSVLYATFIYTTSKLYIQIMFNIVVKCVSLLAVSFALALFSNNILSACICRCWFFLRSTDDIEFTAISFWSLFRLLDFFFEFCFVFHVPAH